MTGDTSAPARENIDHYHEWLFLKTLDDIAARATPAWGGGWDGQDHYELLGLAPLLRKLLLERRSLMQVMRFRRRDVPVLFPVAPESARRVGHQMRSPDAVLTIHFTNVPLWTEATSEHLPLKAFLKVELGAANEHAITVADLIRYYAHVEGGVHIGDPNDEHEVLLASMSAQASTGGTTWAFLLAEISRSVLAGLRPLREAIEADPAPAFDAHRQRRAQGGGTERTHRIGRTTTNHAVMHPFEASAFDEATFRSADDEEPPSPPHGEG